MDRKSADRIIVKSNARMTKVIEWYYANRDWLDKEEFHAPMESGVIELQEESLEITFENKGSIVELAIYPTIKPNIPASLIYDYDMDDIELPVCPSITESKKGFAADSYSGR